MHLQGSLCPSHTPTPPHTPHPTPTPGHRLTVEEHVWFYGRLRGVRATALGPEQERLIQDVGLTPKRDTQTRHLSGEPAERECLRGRGALRFTRVGKGE